jgi:DNA-binding GntR family transcriptional regulator
MSAQVHSVVSPHSLAGQAYAQLEEKLVTLALQPGAVVSEGHMIEITGLGRTPVREAIQRLAHQDLVKVIPRKGLMVTPVSRTGMLDILEARKPLERLLVYRASLNANDAQRSTLSGIARELTISHDRFPEFLRLDQALNALLDECSGNPYAISALAPLRSHCRRFWFFHQEHIQLSDSIQAHGKMARLVARRDFNGAQKAVDGVISVLERLVTSLDPID